jgi:hypothetical protein
MNQPLKLIMLEAEKKVYEQVLRNGKTITYNF